MEIPQIDIGPFLTGEPKGRKQVIREWAHAFETVGFATITGHGVPEKLASDVHKAAQSFFALPLKKKQNYKIPGEAQGQGYLDFAVESLARTLGDEAPDALPDLNEQITFTYIDWEQRDTLNDFDASIFRPNVWPDSPPGFADLLVTYFYRVYALGQDLMRIGALALDLPEDYFGPSYNRMTTQLRLTNYPDQEVPPKPGQLRAGAHTDYLGFTILRQDDAPGGLQVRREDGGWIDVAPVPGGFVINAGDLLSRWTNNRWKSNVHRVVNPPRELTGSSQRTSVVLFTGPNHDSIIKCLPTCQSEENLPRYETVRAWEHFMEKMRASMSAVTQ